MIFTVGNAERPKAPSGTNEVDAFRVPSRSIVDWFAQQNLNPCFLPQVRSFPELVIMTPFERVDSASLVDHLRGQVAAEHGKLCVVLTPRLATTVRDEVVAEFHASDLSAAVIDDLDLCRLLNPGGRRINLVIGLLELVFEQQRRQRFTPFERHDGQHVKLEMFVGRAEQAREIAQTSQYSRLFSGRKLGKSALLSYVGQKYDGQLLPSSNRLRVLYVSGVSAGEEADFVDRVLDAMSEGLGFHPDAADGHRGFVSRATPASRLVAAFEQFTRERQRESLLILFDEADLFVERQIDEYDRRSEECLSFVIRSQIESRRDEHGLPRMRFLFSGYRLTHTNAGAWAGAWGDVLRLEPLQPDEAATLVRGPMERLGICATDVANLIAWRCGYQPSIIISFCRQLLQSVRSDQITAGDVATAFDDPKIQDEIRTVIESNFQGNNLARIVFLATVLVFHERHPLEGIHDLPETLLDRFRSIYEDLRWLQASDEKSALSRIASFVQDFVRRQLLRFDSNRDGVVTYFPRFPHHLPILAQEFSRDPEGKIRGEIEAYLRGREYERESSAPIRSLFPRSVTERLRDALTTPPDPELPIRAVIVTSVWKDAVPVHVLLPAATEISAGSSLATTLETIQYPNAAVQGAGPELLEAIGARRPSASGPPLLIGGADLLRSALARERDFGDLYETAGLGRISRTALEWWFHRFRALELEPKGYDLIMERTAGIPWLVSLFDAHLREHSAVGANLSYDEVISFGNRVFEGLTESAQQLRDGPPAVRLTRREIEIIKMVCLVSNDPKEQGQPLSMHLTSAWQIFCKPDCLIEPLSPTDEVAMGVVQQLGFVPVNPDVSPHLVLDRFVGLHKDDALFRLAAELG